jgi:predicted negative regulator of RcsB-dependent stress response
MSDEFESAPEQSYSAFWPLLILMLGIFGWTVYQVYATNSQRNVYDRQFQQALPTITEAQNVSNRYVALMKDLVETAQKDPAAADIVKAAIQSGMIHVQPNATNGTATPAEPPKP